MRWPDIFFKARKPREEVAPSPASKPSNESPKLASTVSPTPIDRPTTVLPRVKPETSVKEAMAEADPLRALTQSGTLRLSKRTSVETPAPAPSETSAAKTETPVVPVTENKETVSQTPTEPVTPIVTTGLRRKAKLTDLARILGSPAPEKVETPPAFAPESSAVIPPAFTVPVSTGSVIPPVTENGVPAPEEKEKTPETVEVKSEESSPPTPEPEKKEEPVAAEKTASSEPLPEFKAEEASKESQPETSSSIPLEHVPVIAGEKKEFLLANGERIIGRILSETDDMLYLDHGTLGVLTLPRAQIAKRPVEIILINGDRIVGDIMAETPDTLYVRHASLGMLTVPKAQRSTRVVEAILKDGDRILGEVLAETENFTVIRSATLGTVAVPHNKVAMLNRKIEQMELKSLPPAAPELKDKPSD